MDRSRSRTCRIRRHPGRGTWDKAIRLRGRRGDGWVRRWPASCDDAGADMRGRHLGDRRVRPGARTHRCHADAGGCHRVVALRGFRRGPEVNAAPFETPPPEPRPSQWSSHGAVSTSGAGGSHLAASCSGAGLVHATPTDTRKYSDQQKRRSAGPARHPRHGLSIRWLWVRVPRGPPPHGDIARAREPRLAAPICPASIATLTRAPDTTMGKIWVAWRPRSSPKSPGSRSGG